MSSSETPVQANDYLLPEHLSATRWLALPELYVGDDGAAWQDVSLRPELGCDASTPGALGIARLRPQGFTVEICANEVLEEDFEHAAGPHPRELLPAGEEAAFDVSRMAVYVARPFNHMEALAYAELLMVEAGIPVRSLEQASREEFYGGSARGDAR